MANWCLLIIDNTSHLVNLDSNTIEIKNFGIFPSEFLREQEKNVNFIFFEKEAKLIPHSLSDIQKNLVRGPQIISSKDIAWIIHNLDFKSGDIIIEAGGGSGALTTALAQTAYPEGKVISFEKNKNHHDIVKRNLQLSPFSDQVDLRNEELNEDSPRIKCNSIVLDLPEPHKLLNWAEESLVLGGKLLCYIPTTNQVENLLSSLNGWAEIEISEIIHRTWQSNSEALRPNTNILGHTGFILSARLF